MYQSSQTTAIEKFMFNGDELEIIKDGEELWISVRRMCDNLGLNPDGQRVKLSGVSWARTEIISVRDAAGRNQDHFMISLHSLAGWLFSINTNKVAEEVRPKIELYQKEASKVLYEHFFIRPRQAPVVTRLDEENMLLNRRKVGLQLMGDFVKQGLIPQTQFLEQWNGCSSLFFGTIEETKFEDQELYVQDFLLSKGLKDKEIRSRSSQFGKLAKQRYFENHGENPEVKKRLQPDGTFRSVNKYTEKDRPLFEAIFLTMFGHDKELIARNQKALSS